MVPLPLHIFLGLGNQLVELVEKALTENDDQADFAIFIGGCKSTPADINGASKQSAAQSLKGGELKKIAHSPEFFRLIDCVVNEDKKLLFHSCLHSFRALVPFLLSPATMNRRQISEFTELVIFIGDTWHRSIKRIKSRVVKIVKPKVHMLAHCMQFAQEHHGLGAYNESPMESSHHDVHLTFERHSNCGRNTPLKECRTQSDISQRRLSRIASGRIPPPPTPRLCQMCGRPRAKYINNGQLHQRLAI